MRLALPASLLFVMTCALMLASQATAADQVAPPATPVQSKVCGQRAEAARATQDEVQQVRGEIMLRGCVADTSGIDTLLLRWTRDDASSTSHGRICTDPTVTDATWECIWDTSNMVPGMYEVELVALDAAGNRGTSTRSYEIETPIEAPPTTKTPPEIVAPAQPTEPAQPSEPTVLPDPIGEISALRALVNQRIDDCISGGIDGVATDADEVLTQGQQARAVLACATPAFQLAGAYDVSLSEGAVEPITVVIHVESAGDERRLIDAVPAQIAGVPVRVERMTAEQIV